MKLNINQEKYTVEDKHKQEDEKTDFEDDYLVKSMGAFGRWQGIVCLTLFLSRPIAMWNIISFLFLTPATEFVCKQFKDNSTMVEIKISTCYDNCLEYKFSKDVFEKTLITDFGLICDRAWMASFTQTVLMFGVVVGLGFFGWISDRFGRRKALFLSAAIDAILTISSSFAPNYWIFTVIRFFVGVCSAGIISITAVFTSEIVGPQYRELAGTFILMPDFVAQSLLAAFAYINSTWNIYLLEYGSISAVILILLLFLPESPRWLMANSKSDEAVALMTRAAKFNNLNTSSIKDNVEKSLQELNLKCNKTQKQNYLDLFKTKRLCVITLSSFTVWFVTGVCYFGINQYTTALGSNVFIVVAVIGFIQLPMAPLATVLTKVYGRKASTICSFIAIGVTMIAVIFLPNGTWISTTFAIIGVLASCLSFCVLYLYAVELYPTPMRNMGFSLSSSGSKLGGMLSPFVASIRPLWVASLIFAVLPFIAALICLLLPETKGRKLRDTANE